jgi:predicted nucleic acid-binding Zn ribbon protein
VSRPDPPADDPSNSGQDESPPPRGADLAREALAAARARSAARRQATPARTGTARRGQRRRWSGASPDMRDPAPFGALARGWVKRTGDPVALAEATVITRWPDIVGADLAAHCRPVKLTDGVLSVQAESTAWATQIRMVAPAMLAKIAAAVGANQVRSIRTTGPSSPSWKFGPRHVRGRGPRDTYG